MYRFTDNGRILTGTFCGEHRDETGITEANFNMTVMHIGGRAIWCANRKPILALTSAGLVASNIFLDAAIGRGDGAAIELEPAIQDAFDSVYAVLGEAYAR